MKKGLLIALLGLATGVTGFAFSGKTKSQPVEEPKKQCSQWSQRNGEEKADCCDYQSKCCTKTN